MILRKGALTKVLSVNFEPQSFQCFVTCQYGAETPIGLIPCAERFAWSGKWFEACHVAPVRNTKQSSTSQKLMDFSFQLGGSPSTWFIDWSTSLFAQDLRAFV